MGRSLDFLKQLSMKSGMPIVASCGYYAQPFYPPEIAHHERGSGALAQLDLFESMGVEPQRVAIGHVGGLIDPKVEVHNATCKRGAFVGFDRQGGPGDAGLGLV